MSPVARSESPRVSSDQASLTAYALQASEARAEKLAEELRNSKKSVMELSMAAQDMEEQRKDAVKSRQQTQATHVSNLSMARRYEAENTKKLTRQTPVLDVLSALEADGESQQKEIVVLEKEIKTLKRAIIQKDKVTTLPNSLRNPKPPNPN